ncbi:MAG TPA: TMEM175 family protein [Nitrososphaeraceae archaeon]|nr:TMEM175 family protein [Nitrososphaeraceae archaeon]
MNREIRIEHVISFADAIFAFSITFMAISIQIPDLPENLTQPQVINRLLELRPQFEIYVISFFVIGIYWISYHQVFNRIADSHPIMVWLTLIFLFFITLISFATDLQVDYGFYQIVFILYALVLTLAGSLLTLIWLHATKNRLIDKSLSKTEIQNISLQSILPPSIFAISILISVINLQIAYYFWMVIIPAKIITRKKYQQ